MSLRYSLVTGSMVNEETNRNLFHELFIRDEVKTHKGLKPEHVSYAKCINVICDNIEERYPHQAMYGIYGNYDQLKRKRHRVVREIIFVV